jgi:hypothetical protein
MSMFSYVYFCTELANIPVLAEKSCTEPFSKKINKVGNNT